MLKHNKLRSLFLILMIFICRAAIVHPENAETEKSEALDYIIEPGDTINITVEGYEEDYNQTAVVRRNGKITYKSFGEIEVAGLIGSQIEDEIKEKLQPYISDPQVKVSVRRRGDIIEPGDVISIVVEGNKDYNQTAVVQRNGKIIYKPSGEIKAGGLATPQLEEDIEGKLLPYISDPQVKVSIVQKGVLPEEAISEAEARAWVKPQAEKKVKKPEPEKKEYLISPGDVIDIVVRASAGSADYNRTVVVQPDGKIFYPPLGEISANGFTEDQLSQQITTGLSSYTSNPHAKAAVRGRIEFSKVEKYLIKPRDVINITVEGHDD